MASRIHGWQLLIQRIAALGPVARVLARVAPHADRFVLRLSQNRYTLTSLIAGLPVIALTTTGARAASGRVGKYKSILSALPSTVQNVTLRSMENPGVALGIGVGIGVVVAVAVGGGTVIVADSVGIAVAVAATAGTSVGVAVGVAQLASTTTSAPVRNRSRFTVH